MSDKQTLHEKLKSTMVFHIVNDLILCFSLFFFPDHFIEFSGWKNFDPFALRLVAAGLSAVSIQLYLQRNNLEIYKIIVNIKLTTFGLAALGTLITMMSNDYSPTIAEWVLFFGTAAPFLQIGYWKRKLDAAV
jgi:hypothetical protein